MGSLVVIKFITRLYLFLILVSQIKPYNLVVRTKKRAGLISNYIYNENGFK